MEPDQILEEAALLFRERNKEYGAAYLQHGDIMDAFFPSGITLNSAEAFGHFHIFELEVIKMNRIAKSFSKGKFHHDSHMDLMVYPAMAIRLNQEYNKTEEEEND